MGALPAGPALVVFLRHFGCTFCREAIDDVARQRDDILAAGASAIVFIHASPPSETGDWFADPRLKGCVVISDPEREHYRAFGLGRTGPEALVSPKVWARGAASALSHGFGVQPPELMRQLPGVFVVKDGRILEEFRHASPADRPDYVALVRRAIRQPGYN